MSGLGSLRQLLQEAHHARPQDLPEMAMRVAPQVGATAVVIYVVDHQQRELRPLPGGSTPARKPLMIDGTRAGQAYTRSVPCPAAEDEGAGLWVPILDGVERLGVLEVAAGTPLDDRAVDDCMTLASLFAELLITRAQYSDMLEKVRRRKPMQLAAELLRGQLPPLSFSTGHVLISGMLEPCYDVGGDAFDYAVNGDTAHLALFDATGHGSAGGMRSVMLVSLALAAYRNARRLDLDLIATYHHIDAAIRDHDRSGLITAVLAELDQRTGRLRVISAGHPSGMVLRDGQVVRVLPTPTALPVVLGDQRPPLVIEEQLIPGDLVLLHTDGITEARSPDGGEFGLDRLVSFACRAAAEDVPLPETTRRLVHAILDHQHGHLQDDATILIAQWLSPAPPHADAEPVAAPTRAPLDLPDS
ncbi:PP2C family protein-serine/threonine phosphatase [Actinoplanes sp. CA-051413]|uniref:PP2C family protein-serine/threonine phosphatase n=1 Tax=Actinoplanes sp. CA-051413 TaxID=3239899 RepID=UPI003D95540E